MRSVLRVTSLLMALVASGPLLAQEEPMSWPEAVELLQRERLSGEVCARVMKRTLPAGDMAALNQADLDYETARSAFNGVIVGLQAALDDKQEAPTLADVEARITAGSEARQAFCSQAQAMLPPTKAGEKGVIGDVVAASVGELLKAGVAIWERLRDDDALRRASLRTALEDAKWPAFSAVES